jgi:hypothetical protein
VRGDGRRRRDQGGRDGIFQRTKSMRVMVARGPVWDDGLGIRLFVGLGGGASVWPTMKCAHTMEGVWSLFNQSYWLWI